MIKYLHYRKVEEGVPQPKGGVTIAYEVRSHSIVEDDVKYAYAYCSRDDNFSRPRGREIATNRLQDRYHSELMAINNGKHFPLYMDGIMRARFGLERRRKRVPVVEPITNDGPPF